MIAPQDKVVLVTGGAKGIGRMISEGFVVNGARVYISSRDEKACEEACKELNALGVDTFLTFLCSQGSSDKDTRRCDPAQPTMRDDLISEFGKAISKLERELELLLM